MWYKSKLDFDLQLFKYELSQLHKAPHSLILFIRTMILSIGDKQWNKRISPPNLFMNALG